MVTKRSKNIIALSFLLVFTWSNQNISAQQTLAQQAYALIEHHCSNCHGKNGAFTEQLVINHVALTAPGGAILPGNPQGSTFYQRLLDTDPARRMPLAQPPLSPQAIETIQQWIAAGAPDWDTGPSTENPFLSHAEMLTRVETHVNSLPAFDRAFARYFSLTHLYNAGETREALSAYQIALSKLVNSLSWGHQVIKPEPIDTQETLFYIDLRHYEWDVQDAWTQIENVYPYHIPLAAPTQTALREKLSTLQQKLNCEVPFVHVDWFLATASLPPLYHDILGLPQTDSALEARLEVDVVRNLRNAPGVRVWRAGFNDSGVSNHNRVVERHTSRYGAYWKSYDFAGSADRQNIFTRPLSFQHDGGEIVFNLPNGLQGYYISDAGGNRIDVAPTDIVSNPAASDPAVRNGLSCIGCHTEGMKTFADAVRAAVERAVNPPYNKEQALRLYVAQEQMDALVAEDTERYREALEAAGGVFGGIEPVQRFYEVFQGPVDASHAAAAVGLETDVFLSKVGESARLQNLGLLSLEGEDGNIKRDAWTEQFGEIVSAVYSPDASLDTPIVPQTEVLPGSYVHIPDANLRAAIAEALGKAPNATITAADMEKLTELGKDDGDITDLTGLQFATNLEVLQLRHNLISDISALASLKKLRFIRLAGNQITDISALAGLTNLAYLSIYQNEIADITPLAGLTNMAQLSIYGNQISDLSPLASLTKLHRLRISWKSSDDPSVLAGLTNMRILVLSWGGDAVEDLSFLTNLSKLEELDIKRLKPLDTSPLAALETLKSLTLEPGQLSDISFLTGLTNLTYLNLSENEIIDLSFLTGLTNLTHLNLSRNEITDISPLAGLVNLEELHIRDNLITDFSPIETLSKNIPISSSGNPGALKGGPKIAGPWLWVVVPGEDFENMDLLARASNGEVTEAQVALNGATAGKPVGDNVWILHQIATTGNQNIIAMAEALGIEIAESQEYVAYGVVTLESPREQVTKMFAGSDDYHKIWLNGELVNENWIPGGDYQVVFPVTLKQGDNVLLVAVHNHHLGDGREWMGHFGFAPDVDYIVSNSRIGYTFSKSNIHAGDTFTLDIGAKNFIDLAGWQFDIAFDPRALEAVEVSEGDFLKGEGGTTFFQKGTINNTAGKITKLSAARIAATGAVGTGTLLSVTFKAKAVGDTQLTLQNFQFGDLTGAAIPAGPQEVVISIAGELAIGDVNRDGQVSILDMILVARQLGERVPANTAVDVNNDGAISVLDLILISQRLGESTAAAPSVVAIENAESLNPAVVQAWLSQAQLKDDGSVVFREGIAKLQALLETLTVPDQTALLANYPNPFNPETWLPYQLSTAADVSLTIHAADGVVVRRLALGHQAAGIYQSRSRAAYWDGRNAVGEPVASGIYFYTLTAGDFTATRKMLIRK